MSARYREAQARAVAADVAGGVLAYRLALRNKRVYFGTSFNRPRYASAALASLAYALVIGKMLRCCAKCLATWASEVFPIQLVFLTALFYLCHDIGMCLTIC